MRLRIRAPWPERRGKCQNGTIAPPTRLEDPFFGIEDGKETGNWEDPVAFCNGVYDGVECPIRDACLIFALTNNLKHGVWGGTTPDTRRLIRRQWPLRSGKTPRPEWHWMTEEDAWAMFPPEEQARIRGEPWEEEGEEDEWVA